MRCVLVAMLGLLGCDQVLGLEHRDAPLEILPTAPAVVSIDHPPSLVTLGTATITAHLRGEPDTTVVCVFSAMGGSVANGDVTVTFDANGIATATAQYVAPATAGNVTLRAAIGDSEVRSTLAILPVVTVGFDQMLVSSTPVTAGIMVGTRVEVTAAYSPVRIGVWPKATFPSTQGRLGVYRDNGMLVGEVGPVSIATGRNEFPIVLPTLAPGTYFIVSVLDAGADYYYEPTNPSLGFVASAALDSSQSLPAMRPASIERPGKHSHFLKGSN